MVNVCNGTLGDLYNSAIWIGLLFANSIVILIASMPLDAYLRVLVGRGRVVTRKASENCEFDNDTLRWANDRYQKCKSVRVVAIYSLDLVPRLRSALVTLAHAYIRPMPYIARVLFIRKVMIPSRTVGWHGRSQEA